MLRRTLATVAAAGIALAGLAPTAQAQNLDGLIANADCRVVEIAVKGAFRIDGNTTRSDLAKQIRDAARPVTGTDPAAFLLGAQYSNQIADKALACGIVKPDPQLIPGLDNLGNIQDIIQGLSSTLAPR